MQFFPVLHNNFPKCTSRDSRVILVCCGGLIHLNVPQREYQTMTGLDYIILRDFRTGDEKETIFNSY